jgi:anaerobic magnesium-protoporphyrin IX monomethyl ester cyclase
MLTLINPPGLKSLSGLQMHTPNPPLGLAYIAGALKAAGVPYAVIDATGEALDNIDVYPARQDFMIQGLGFDAIVRRVAPGTRIVGLTCMFSTLWPLTRDLAAHIRRHFPHVLIVLGGEHGTAVPEVVLRNSAVGVVVLGEGEETIVQIATAVAEGRTWRELPGIAHLDANRFQNNGLSARIRKVDDIVLPDWDSFPIEEYISRHQINGLNLGRSMPLLATRGCPYQCTFCSNPGMWTTRYVPRDPAMVADEIELYINRYKVVNVDFQDLTAIVKRRWVVDFCNELIRRRLNITWQMPSGTRSEVFDEEVADLLYRSGCRALAFAPESGAPEILEKVKKQVNLDHMLKAMRIAVRRGFKLSCFIVIGFPDDTPVTLRKTLGLVRHMAVLGVHDVGVAKFIPYPGSDLFKRLQREGRLEMDDRFFLSPMDFYSRRAPSYSDQLSAQRLFLSMLWMYLNFYTISFACKPIRTIRILSKAVVTGSEETRFARWLNDLLFVRRRWRRAAKAVRQSRSQAAG